MARVDLFGWSLKLEQFFQTFQVNSDSSEDWASPPCPLSSVDQANTMGICDPAVASTVKMGMAAKLESWDGTVTCESCMSMRTQWDTIQALGSTHHSVKWDLLLWHPTFLWFSKVHAWLFRHCMVQSGGMAKHDITKTLLAFNAKAFPATKNPALPLSPHNVELSSIQVLGENQDLVRKPCPLGGNTYWFTG